MYYTYFFQCFVDTKVSVYFLTNLHVLPFINQAMFSNYCCMLDIYFYLFFMIDLIVTIELLCKYFFFNLYCTIADMQFLPDYYWSSQVHAWCLYISDQYKWMFNFLTIILTGIKTFFLMTKFLQLPMYSMLLFIMVDYPQT